MVAQHYRWDFIQLSTDPRPTPETSEKVVDGSTLYCSDTSKLYVFCKDEWYERKPLGGGGTTYTAGDGINIADNTISVDTTTIQPKLTAGTNITISDNTISATDTTYSNFTGTDGTAAGTAGLVPAPATTDAGKFLKADGTWNTVVGDIIELTSADYDYPTDNPDGIALWNLPNGFYKIGNTAYVKVYYGKANATGVMESINLISDYLNISGNSTVDQYRYVKKFKTYSTIGSYTVEGISSFRIHKTTHEYDASPGSGIALRVTDLVYSQQLDNPIDTSDSLRPLSSEAGKNLAQRVTVGGNNTPGDSTLGVLGSLHTTIESGTPHLYMCTAVSGSTKTWTDIEGTAVATISSQEWSALWQ